MNCKKLLTTSAVLTACFLLAAKAVGIRINTTASMPRGVWMINHLQRSMARGDAILFCPPPTALFRRAYTLRVIDWGFCDGGFSPLIKEITGIPGDHIHLEDRVHINGQIAPRSEIKSRDFESFKPSDITLREGEYWVMGTNSERSFDSRYFGPIQETALIGVMIPLWIWTY